MSNTVKVKLGNKSYNLSNDSSEIDLKETAAKVDEMFDFIRKNALPPSASEQDVAALSALSLYEEAKLNEIKFKESLDYLENEITNMSNIISESLS